MPQAETAHTAISFSRRESNGKHSRIEQGVFPLKLVINTFGSAGDVHPFVALGAEALRRGHSCTIITNGKFRPVVERHGLRFIEVGTAEDYDRLIHDPRLWDPNRALEFLLESLPRVLKPSFHAIEEECGNAAEQCLLVGSSLGFAARVARDILMVPMVSVHLSPSLFWSADAPPLFTPWVRFLQYFPAPMVRCFFELMDSMIDGRLSGKLQLELRGIGYPPIRHLFSRWIHSPDLTVGMFPSWFCESKSDWPNPIFLSGFPMFRDGSGGVTAPPELERFLASGAAPVAFAPGSANHQGAKFFREALAACAALNCRGVFITPAGESVPAPLPPSVIHVPYVSFEQLFPRCAAVVHHGGIGTSAQCLAAGMPQLVMPMAHDQFDNADRLERLGVALSLREKRFREPRVSRLLARLLENSSFKSRAEEWQRPMAPGPDWDGLFGRFEALLC